MQPNQVTSLVCCVLSALSLATATAADGFLDKKIAIRGTNIDRFPDFVEVITSDPRGAAAKLFAAGGRSLSEHSLSKNRFTVFHHEVPHIFHTVDDYDKTLRGHSFKDGDVVYKYFLNSEAEEERFAKRYSLKVVTRDTRLGNLSVVLYSAAPGFYVIASGKRAGIAYADDSDTTPAGTSKTTAISVATESTDKKPEQVSTSEFTPQLNGREVTVTFEVKYTQHVAGVRDGEFPTLLIHHVRLNPSDRVVIYVKGDLADVLRRVDRVGKDSLKGRRITATGAVVAREVLDDAGQREPLYELVLQDWKKFQVIRDE